MYMADAVYMLIKGYEITKVRSKKPIPKNVQFQVSIQDNGFKKFPKKFVIKFPTATSKFKIYHLSKILKHFSPKYG